MMDRYIAAAERAEHGRPLFVSIQTTAFSGATLLAFLLGAHPQIATVGEMNGLIAREDPEIYLCSCGQKIKECPFWGSVGRAMHARGFEFCVAHFDMGFGLDGPWPTRQLRTIAFRNRALESIRDALVQAWPGERRRLQALVARNEAFVESVLAVTGKRVFVDTSKDRLRLRALRKFSSFDLRVIHLVRDVRGVVASRLRRNVGVEAREAARQWARLHQRHQRMLDAWPEAYRIQIRYEDLCQDVQSALTRLYRFCGVDPEFRIGDFRSMPHHIVGNAMRLANLSEIRLDEQWRNLLTEDQIKEIYGVAGGLSRQFGYC
jgi:hypothetical protein